jgi:hypothetical protein
MTANPRVRWVTFHSLRVAKISPFKDQDLNISTLCKLQRHLYNNQDSDLQVYPDPNGTPVLPKLKQRRYPPTAKQQQSRDLHRSISQLFRHHGRSERRRPTPKITPPQRRPKSSSSTPPPRRHQHQPSASGSHLNHPDPKRKK